MSAVRNKITFSIETIEWFDLRITNVSRASLNYGWWSYQIYTEVCSIHYHGQNYYLRWHVFFFYFCFTCFLIILSIPRKIPRKRTNINLEITIHRTYIRGDRTWRSAIARFEIVCWIWSRRTKIPTYIFPFRKSTWNEIRGFSLKNPWATIRWNKRAWKHLAWNSVS